MPDAARLRQLFELGKHPLKFVGGSQTSGEGLDIETLTFQTLAGENVRGILTRPAGASGKLPAILLIHAHGNRYHIGAGELLDGRPALQSAPGPVFAGEGFAALCIDLPCFGERQGITESAATKAALWHGGSLAGQMLAELSSVLDWLCARPDIDTRRIGCFGISMGATLGYWLAAVDQRISAIVHQCCFANFEELIQSGAHDLHGIYLTVPNLLNVASNGQIAGMIAPRPQLACIGDLDPLTPPSAANPALAELVEAYRKAGVPELLEIVREPQSGHVETPAMRKAMLSFFKRHLF